MNQPIIPRSPPGKNGKHEKNDPCSVIRDNADLCARLGLPPATAASAMAAEIGFPLRVTQSFLQRIEYANPDDPLLKQILPQPQEREEIAGFSADPVGDLQNSVSSGVIHKYRNRVLLTVTGVCAIHCRYCFRRNFPYSIENPKRNNWDDAIGYIARHPEIEEVILSGGDPLMVELEMLKGLVRRIEAIAHIRRIRIHSRVPVVAPERINPAMVAWLGQINLPLVMVIHSNHPNEISTVVAATLSQLSQAGVRLMNQSVLLKGVNDSAEVLARLSNRLFDVGVQPYYLNLLDRAHGAAHFEVGDKQARELIATLQSLLPGYLMPKIVRDKGEDSGKVVFGLESL